MRRLVLASLPLWTVLMVSACGEERPSAPVPAQPGRYDATGRLFGPAPERRARPNLVLVVLDTLRADAVGWPGGPAGLMPHVSGVAADGVLFTDATAPAPWTVPSFTSLLTGMLPSAHGCDAPLQPPRLVESVTTFAEVLRSTYGYQTAAFVAGPWFSPRDSVLQGFETTVHPFALRAAPALLAPFLDRRGTDRPFFLLLHSYEPHDPYGEANHPFPARPRAPDPEARERVRALSKPWELARHVLLSQPDREALYDLHGPELTRTVVRYLQQEHALAPQEGLSAELRAAYEDGVRWVDGLVGALLAYLRERDALENTLLVITSDHGEAFGEHGTLTHGGQLFDEQIRVPLVLAGHGPCRGGRVVGGGVGLVDVLPTFLDLAGCVPLGDVHGQSFRARIEGAAGDASVFSEETRNRESTGSDVLQVLTSVRSARWKYVVTFDQLAGTVLESAYDLLADPGERTDLCAGRGRVDGLAFDPAFCQAVERARDRIWGAARTSTDVARTPYGGGRALVTSERPRACGAP